MKRLYYLRNVAVLLLATLMLSSCCWKKPVFGNISIDKIIENMTLKEKAALLVGTGGYNGDSIDIIISEARNLIPGCAGTTCPIPRLSIPAIQLPDGPAGLRINPLREGSESTYYCTAFPIASMLASTWNTELVIEAGKAIGNEVKKYGADVILAPAMNIHRNPLCGRNFEYYSEDPFVTGKISAAMVNGIQQNGVGATIKHFALNNQETNRYNSNSIVSERTAREIYLKGFEIAIKESSPWAIMTSYNKINGVFAAENSNLLDSILRLEWGFEGMVMTDWGGGSDVIAMMSAGNDLLMPGTMKQIESIMEAVNNNSLSISYIDRNVKRILQLIEKTPKHSGYIHNNNPNLATHAQISKNCATEGMVLLKNSEQTLPISDKAKRIALYGVNSYNLLVIGTGSGSVNYKTSSNLDEGLTKAGYILDPSISTPYINYTTQLRAKNGGKHDRMMGGAIDSHIMPESLLRPMFKLKADAIANDLAIVTIGRSCGEFRDRTYSDDYLLSATENSMILDVCEAFHSKGKRVIVVLNIGAPIETTTWKDRPDAILLAGLPGQEGGDAITDILSGKVNPSGKLVDTYPISYFDTPSSKNFPHEPRLLLTTRVIHTNNSDKNLIANYDFTRFEEELNVGYRYFDQYPDKISFPFGFGLSYTTFEYEEPRVNHDKESLTIYIKVTNTGNIAGKEAVQIYIEAPTNNKDLPKPIKELKAFGKTSLLEPGESQILEMRVSEYDLASFSESLNSWVTSSGEYKICFASSSQHIRQSVVVNLPETKLYPSFGSLQ